MEKTDKNLDNQTVNNYYINTSPKSEKKRTPKKIITEKNDLDLFMENNSGISQFFAEGIEEECDDLPGDFFEPKQKKGLPFFNYIVVLSILFLTFVTIIYNIFYIKNYERKIEKINIEIAKTDIEIESLLDELNTVTLTNLNDEYIQNGYKKNNNYKTFTPLDKQKVEDNTHKGNFFDIICQVIHNFMCKK